MKEKACDNIITDRRLVLSMRFDGTDYCGWQVQPNGVTIQQTLQDAVQKATGVRYPITGCSRTDSGVHADMFVAAFDYSGDISAERMPFAINAYLPADICVYGCREAEPDFHPRYSAVSKEYHYHILASKFQNPFYDRFSYNIKAALDVEAMKLAAGMMTGERDFTSFCAAGASVDSKVRNVMKSEIEYDEEKELVIFKVSANGFLYNMVRIMAGTLADVGLGKIFHGDIAEIIGCENREKAGRTAPAKGLFLKKVTYRA